MSNYAHPEVLVTTDWVDDHKKDPQVTIVEVDVDTTAYEKGHIPGAIGWNWQTQLCDTVQRDIIPPGQLQQLLQESGISEDSTVVLYGDNNNWFAAWAHWQLKMYGVADVRIMDGGRKKWEAEGRALNTDTPQPEASNYQIDGVDEKFRIFLPEVMDTIQLSSTALVDVRSGDEFTGKILAPPGLPETCQRGGHIPGAKNIGWSMACKEDGTFKNYDELKALYEEHGVTSDKNVITYCRIGERSSHSWFVLKYLLGYDKVRNYDGSWTEWGNLVGAPIEKGEEQLAAV